MSPNGELSDVSFVVLAHDDVDTLRQLLKALDPYRVYIHWDAASPDRLPADLFHRPRTYSHPRPFRVNWGGFSVLQAMIETLELTLSSAEQTPSHIAFLTGHCYPLRPVQQFVNHLQQSEYSIHLRACQLLDDPSLPFDQTRRRVSERHYLDGSVAAVRQRWPMLGRGIRRSLRLASGYLGEPAQTPSDLYCGSQLYAISGPLAKEVVAEYRRGSFDYLKNAFVPDEIALATYVYNSRWRHETQHRAPEALPPTAKVSALANFHWLRPDMRGYVDVREVKAALRSEAYFIRKIRFEASSPALRTIHDSWHGE